MAQQILHGGERDLAMNPAPGSVPRVVPCHSARRSSLSAISRSVASSSIAAIAAPHGLGGSQREIGRPFGVQLKGAGQYSQCGSYKEADRLNSIEVCYS